MRSGVLLSLILSCLVASGAAAQTVATQTPIWKWDDRTRIAMRLDPVAMAQRVAAHKARLADAPQFVIDGNANPELFLPFELFEALLNDVDPRVGDETARQASRESYSHQLSALGFDPSGFWTDLGRIASPYLTARVERDATAAVELCRARYVSLNTARTHFGPRFDEFLYTGVAPKLHVASAKPSAGQAAGLEFLADGCHD